MFTLRLISAIICDIWTINTIVKQTLQLVKLTDISISKVVNDFLLHKLSRHDDTEKILKANGTVESIFGSVWLHKWCHWNRVRKIYAAFCERSWFWNGVCHARQFSSPKRIYLDVANENKFRSNVNGQYGRVQFRWQSQQKYLFTWNWPPSGANWIDAYEIEKKQPQNQNELDQVNAATKSHFCNEYFEH